MCRLQDHAVRRSRTLAISVGLDLSRKRPFMLHSEHNILHTIQMSTQDKICVSQLSDQVWSDVHIAWRKERHADKSCQRGFEVLEICSTYCSKAVITEFCNILASSAA